MTESLPLNKSFNPRKKFPFLSSKFKRRCPFQYFYVPVECPLGKNCDDGLCPLSHTKLEIIFHPILHKTKRCSMSLMNVCNFSQRCTFFHNTNDRISSHLSWLVWQKKWNLWDCCSKLTSSKFNLPPDVSRKLSLMISNRLDSQRMFEAFKLEDHSMAHLENQLSAMLDSCDSPGTTASTRTPDTRTFHLQSPEEFYTPVDSVSSLDYRYR